MIVVQDVSSSRQHEYWFEFNQQQYRVHSIVKLTDSARIDMGFIDNEVILVEVYYGAHGRKFWKYKGKDVRYNIGVQEKSIDIPPDEIIEEVVMGAPAEYASREILGVDSPVYAKNGTRHTRKDWEIPELRVAWVIFILAFIFVSIFKDWYIQIMLRLFIGHIFGLRRQAYIKAYTTYTHDEDKELLQHKYSVLHGIKYNQKENNNE